MRLIDADALKEQFESLYLDENGEVDFGLLTDFAAELSFDFIFDMIDGMETEGGWISVNDRMPELFTEKCDDNSGDYQISKTLVFRTDDGTVTSIGNLEDDGVGLFWVDGNGNSYPRKAVSYWMPLPEGQEEEENAEEKATDR